MEEFEKENIEMELFSVQTREEDTARPQWTARDDRAGPKWKRLPPKKSRFVVKDVVFLPRDQYMAQIESLVFSQSTEMSSIRARMTVDHSWSASQMNNRLRLLLRREFGKTVARRIQFTYLQCVQSSRSLFVPSAPADGWSGADILRISALGPLCVLIEQDAASSQVKHEPSSSQPEDNEKNICLDNNEVSTHHRGSARTEALREELQTTLTHFTGEISGVELPLQVRRGAVLPSALKAIRRSGFSFRSTPIISFCGEETEGNQGPLREFFRLMLQELQETSLFEGQPGRLLLTSDLSALEDWRYYEAGLLIGWSLAHGGAGPRFLHPALYQLMCGQTVSLDDFSWRDVLDMEIQSHLLQLQSCSDVRLLSPRLCEWVSSCGVPEISRASAEELPAIYRRVVEHYIHDRVSPMIGQLTEGLNSCDGLWDVMKTHWEAFVPVVTSACSEPLTLENFRELFTVGFSSDCEEEEEKQERETLAHWETVLGYISDGEAALSFEDLLTFITGADHLPPLGFSRPITLRFYSQDAALPSVRLPFASSCSLELFLPGSVGGAAELLMLLTRSVQESRGFTRLNKEENSERSTETDGPTRMTSQ